MTRQEAIRALVEATNRRVRQGLGVARRDGWALATHGTALTVPPAYTRVGECRPDES
jgi:hypothetical protein